MRENDERDGKRIDELTIELARLKKKNASLLKRITELEEMSADEAPPPKEHPSLRDAHAYIIELEDKVQRVIKNSHRQLR